MRIIKKDGTEQSFQPTKLLTRIKKAGKGLKINPDILFQEVVPLLKDGISTTEIDEILAYSSADKIIEHPDYSLLGGRVLMSRQAKILGKEMQEVDYNYDFFSAVTFLSKYGMKVDNKVVELPSDMYERVARHLHSDEQDIKELETDLKLKRSNFATPIYTNSGITSRNSLISCNLTELESDSTEGILNTLDKISWASKEGSGIGLLIDCLRSRHSNVTSFQGKAGGVIRFADMVQSKMRFFKQGSRSGSCALYLSLWHRDIFDFLELTLPVGDEQMRTRDLFLAVVVNDLFMQKLQNNEDWYLFCPKEVKDAGLEPFENLLGEDFERQYNEAVEKGLGFKTTAKEVFDYIIKAQVQSGRPYVMYKENANKRNMQDNISLIKQLNLCAETSSVSLPKYTSQCTLGSINLAQHDTLDTIANSVRIMTKSLNKVIDINKWSDEWSEKAGLDQRSIAIGIAGLADFFAKKKISFESEEAKEWMKGISETIYKASVCESTRLAEQSGNNYPAWKGSRYERGETYIEGWSPRAEGEPIPMLNSLTTANMPTASSAILLGVFESFEPVTSNVFTRAVGQGEFMVINRYLVQELDELGMWTDEIRSKVVFNEGSIQNIMEIPSDIRYRYKDVWEIPQKALLDLSIIRNKYVDQSQSLNIYHADADYNRIAGALMYAWKNGLKTGVYYTRTKSKLSKNSKLSSISQETTKRPENSLFACEGGGCSA